MFAIRSPQAGSQALLGQIRSAVWSKNGSLSLAAERTMRDIYDASMARTSFTLVMLAIAGVMALVLGVIGIYGVLSYAVSQRTREIGIRLALGARPSDVFWLVIGEGASLCTAGILLGLGGAFAVTRWLASELHGVNATDPVTYPAVAAAVAVVSLAACAVPTRRAMRVDPLIVLREP